MVFYSESAMERAMKIQEVILRAMAKKITWSQAARDHRHQRPADAPLVRALPGVWLRRAIRPPIAQAESEARAGGGSRASAGTVPGHVFRSERSALLRKAARGARYRPELYLGQAGLARGWSGEEGASARRSSPATTAAAVAGNAVAFGWQPAPLVWRRSLV